MLTSREHKSEDTTFRIGSTVVGRDFTIIAGPCAVEDEMTFLDTARLVKSEGAHILRGHVYKPRTSPYDFQGLKDDGFQFIMAAKENLNMPIVMEVTAIEYVPIVAEYADLVQVGARNMQHFELLKAVGRIRRPVLLKRHPAATLYEFLMAAEYILQEGNENVILCERGIRSFSDFSRYTLDLTIVPALKERTHLPVFVDPSHASGRSAYVPPLAKAARACGADGLILEVHPSPENARCDKDQALTPEIFKKLMHELTS